LGPQTHADKSNSNHEKTKIRKAGKKAKGGAPLKIALRRFERTRRFGSASW
jgi:hypothetical protein